MRRAGPAGVPGRAGERWGRPGAGGGAGSGLAPGGCGALRRRAGRPSATPRQSGLRGRLAKSGRGAWGATGVWRSLSIGSGELDG